MNRRLVSWAIPCRLLKLWVRAAALCVLLGWLAGPGSSSLRGQTEREKSLVDLANQAREEAGLKLLRWDAGLAAAAKAHAEKMAAERLIAHRYSGEMDLPERAAKAGAHFSLIEENIAMAESVFHVHQSWMKSPAHHENLLSPQIDRIGVGVVEANGVFYACADYAKGVEAMTTGQVEAEVGNVVAAKGVTLLRDSASAARAYCAQESTSDKGVGDPIKPRLLMRWSSADITKLPTQMTQALASRQYKQAAVGACEAAGKTQSFSGYKVAVLLY